ncbi:hypothetical protein C7B76_10450 [filamentous cyanobacterium CCP2]|nr:hypothetical protein C7B76_10450 [filamentous cyanobacterium CCP2]
MIAQEITNVLSDLFKESVQMKEEAWQVEIDNLRLLVLLSDDKSWLRSLVTIAPMQDALPFMQQFLEANFDETQETRYAFFQGLLWGVYQHNRETLTPEDFRSAIVRLVTLQQQGLSGVFSILAETQIRQIVQVAKQQGQTLEATLQTLDRLYEEGVMGDMSLGAEQREKVLGAWRYQLERLWEAE